MADQTDLGLSFHTGYFLVAPYVAFECLLYHIVVIEGCFKTETSTIIVWYWDIQDEKKTSIIV